MRAALLVASVVLASGPLQAQPPPDKPACTLTGRVTFTTSDAELQPSDVVVYVSDGRKKGARLPAATRHEIAQWKKQFTPRTLIVQRADSVAFPNRDVPVEHSVFSSDRTTVRIRPNAKAEPEPATFTREGGFRIQCDIHSKMWAWVVVVPDRSLATQVAGDGRWRIDNVPAGAHTLKVVEPNGATLEVRVTACDGDTPVAATLQGNDAPTLRRFNGSPYGEYQP